MSLLVATGVKRHFGAHEVLRGADLRIERGEKIGCVGRNGGGKSTLLRLIVGLDHTDEGQLALARGTRVGYVPQSPEFEPGVAVRAHVESGQEEQRQLRSELEALEQRLAAPGNQPEELVHRYAELNEQLDFLGGWHADQQIEQVLSGIGLPVALWEREARSLSGGEKSRVALARELVRRPDMLLLDEPTNHLDLPGIEWLESYLKEFPGAVFVISHDRRLLDNVVDTIVELEFGTLRRYPGNYSKYVVLRAERCEAEQRAFDQQQDFISKEEAFIKKHMGSQRTAEAKGRQKRLERLERLRAPRNDVRKPRLAFGAVDRSGERVVLAEGLAIGFGEKRLHQGLDFRLERGDRVGLVGPNGAGKTTLLKTLAGRLPALGGVLELGHRALVGYFDQVGGELDKTSTPYDTLRRDNPLATDQEIRDHLARFLFRGPEVEAGIAGLSGGERARVSLARLVWQKPTWLALDEPTNHLDLAARAALEEMLSSYPGAILCISHDREFLDNLCNRMVELTPRGLREFRGNYSDYRATLAAESGNSLANKAKPSPAPAAATAAKAPGNRAAAAAAGNPPAKTREEGSRETSGAPKIRNAFKFEKLEQDIMRLEEELKSLQAALFQEDVYRDGQRLKETQLRIAEVERDLQEKYHEWEHWQ
jgi:ATP-binding cassette subfamily F protein 3